MKIEFPNDSNLSVQKLAGVFANTTNSYKFYWFLSLLDFVKQGQTRVTLDELIINMLAKVWYPIVFYKLSFGKLDQFSPAVKQIQSDFQISDDISKVELVAFLKANSMDPRLIKISKTISRYVPTRFIAPWFQDEIRGLKDSERDKTILKLAERSVDNSSMDSPIYSFTTDHEIDINPTWFQYLSANIRIIEGFTFWELINYLHQRNPNVPNIASKLEAPEKRNLTAANKYWREYLNEQRELSCIYSQQNIPIKELSIDHFLPWSYVGHDLLWNLIPTTKVVNSKKNNWLPSKIYKEHFAEIQFRAFDFWIEAGYSVKMLEDYVLLFNADIREIKTFGSTIFKQKLWENIEPQLQIATNMGFSTNWKYQNDTSL